MLLAGKSTLMVMASAIIVFALAEEIPTDVYGNVEWTGGPFEWPCPITKSMFKNSGRYIPKNVIASRAAIYDDNAIVALPRYKAGVPATLAKVNLKEKGCQANLVPYPCWSLQEEGSCNALQNVVDLYLDPQNILWVLDTGVVNTLEEPVRKCPPKVLAFNVSTGKSSIKNVTLKHRLQAGEDSGVDRPDVTLVPPSVRGGGLQPRRSGVHLRVRRCHTGYPSVRRHLRTWLSSRVAPSRYPRLHSKRRFVPSLASTIRRKYLLDVHLLERQSHVLHPYRLPPSWRYQWTYPRPWPQAQEDGHPWYGQWQRPVLPVRGRGGRVSMGQQHWPLRQPILPSCLQQPRVCTGYSCRG